jgi:hypothetical protein
MSGLCQHFNNGEKRTGERTQRSAEKERMRWAKSRRERPSVVGVDGKVISC